MDNLLRDGYGHGNRAFLQALLARGTMTFKDARPLIAAINNADNPNADEVTRPDHITEDIFHAYIDMASRAASLFDYEIRSGVHQITKQRVYALVNTASDPQTQLATTYSPEELSFINRVLDAMFDKFNTPRMESMCITGLQAVQLSKAGGRESRAAGDETQQGAAPADKGLKHSEVELVMSSLQAGGWLEKSKDDFYSLTPRALLELRPWLIDSYNDPDAEPGDWQRIKFCEACRDIVTYGQRCAEPDCNARLHDICEEAYWKARKDEKKCPKCARAWEEKLYVGERSITKTAAYRRGHKKSGVRRRELANEIACSQGMEANGEEGEE